MKHAVTDPKELHLVEEVIPGNILNFNIRPS
jgi:hypothetical protein